MTTVINHIRHRFTSRLITIGHGSSDCFTGRAEWDTRACYRSVGGESGRRAEVCQFDVSRAVDEHILRLDISGRAAEQESGGGTKEEKKKTKEDKNKQREKVFRWRLDF